MDKQQLKKELVEFLEFYKKDDELWNRFIELVGHDNPLVNSHFALMDKHLNEFSRKINDIDGWITYYIYECCQGRNPMTVEINGVKRKMKNIDALVWAITTDVKNK